MKKTLLSVALLSTVLSLVGCSGDEQKTVKGAYQITEKFDTTKDVEISFYSTMGKNLLDIYNEQIKEFNKQYPNIKITHTQPGGYDQVRDQIKTELASAGGPDIAVCYPDHVALFNKTKSVVQLDNLIINKDVGITKAQKDDFIKGYYNEGNSFGDGLMYTLPFSKSTEVLYINKTEFQKLNLDYPTTWFSATYDENGKPTDKTSMEYVCEKLLQADPNCIPLGYDSEANWFITMCEQMNIPYTTASGTDHFLFNNDQAKEVMLKLNKWKQKGYFTTQNIYGAYTSGLFVATKSNEKKSYMSIGSSAGATHQRPTKTDDGYPFDVDITPIPQANANNKKVISQGPSLCLFNHGDQQKVLASWLLMRFLTTDVTFQALYADASGYVPVLKSVASNEAYKANLEKADGGDYIAYLSAKVCLEQEKNYFTSPAFLGSSAARDEAGKLLINCVNITKSSEDEIKAEINTKFDAAIAQCKASV